MNVIGTHVPTAPVPRFSEAHIARSSRAAFAFFVIAVPGVMLAVVIARRADGAGVDLLSVPPWTATGFMLFAAGVVSFLLVPNLLRDAILQLTPNSLRIKCGRLCRETPLDERASVLVKRNGAGWILDVTLRHPDARTLRIAGLPDPELLVGWLTATLGESSVRSQDAFPFEIPFLSRRAWLVLLGEVCGLVVLLATAWLLGVAGLLVVVFGTSFAVSAGCMMSTNAELRKQGRSVFLWLLFFLALCCASLWLTHWSTGNM